MTKPTRSDQADDHVDLLIVGAGPAGMMLANWMSRLGIKTRIVDKRGTKVSSKLTQSVFHQLRSWTTNICFP